MARAPIAVGEVEVVTLFAADDDAIAAFRPTLARLARASPPQLDFAQRVAAVAVAWVAVVTGFVAIDK
jgi:hypothetical protein